MLQLIDRLIILDIVDTPTEHAIFLLRESSVLAFYERLECSLFSGVENEKKNVYLKTGGLTCLQLRGACSYERGPVVENRSTGRQRVQRVHN